MPRASGHIAREVLSRYCQILFPAIADADTLCIAELADHRALRSWSLGYVVTPCC
jgi:hypothetical protein